MKNLISIILVFAGLTLGAQNFSDVLMVRDTLDDGKIEFETKLVGRFTDKKDTITIELYMTFDPKIKMVLVEGMFIYDKKVSSNYQFVFKNSSATFKQYDKNDNPDFFTTNGVKVESLMDDLKAIRKNGVAYLPVRGADLYIKMYTTGFERIKCEWY